MGLRFDWFSCMSSLTIAIILFLYAFFLKESLIWIVNALEIWLWIIVEVRVNQSLSYLVLIVTLRCIMKQPCLGMFFGTTIVDVCLFHTVYDWLFGIVLYVSFNLSILIDLFLLWLIVQTAAIHASIPITLQISNVRSVSWYWLLQRLVELFDSSVGISISSCMFFDRFLLLNNSDESLLLISRVYVLQQLSASDLAWMRLKAIKMSSRHVFKVHVNSN